MLGVFLRSQTLRAVSAALTAALAISMLTATAARAEGTARIQQVNGSVNVYHHVKIQIVAKTLSVTSPDGKGTLIIYRAACSYQGQVMMCLPDGVSLVQNGGVSAIKLTSGTVYANLTGEPQNLAMSSTKVPAHSILMALKTRRGTYVTVSGAIDKETK